MCFGGGSPSAGNMAAQTRKREQHRQTRIERGQERIDKNFNQFDDGYFSKFRQDQVEPLNQQIDEQHSTASDRLTAALANRGVLSSTIAGNAFGDLVKTQNDARADAANRASDSANAFRNNVEKTKSDLYAINTASADPQMIAARSRGEATSLVPPQATTPLGNLFGDVLAPFANYTRASMYSPYGSGAGFSFAPTSGRGSGSIG